MDETVGELPDEDEADTTVAKDLVELRRMLEAFRR